MLDKTQTKVIRYIPIDNLSFRHYEFSHRLADTYCNLSKISERIKQKGRIEEKEHKQLKRILKEHQKVIREIKKEFIDKDFKTKKLKRKRKQKVKKSNQLSGFKKLSK